MRVRASLDVRSLGQPGVTFTLKQNSPWRHVEAVEFATLEWIDWFNNRRLLEPIGNIPPVEFEEQYYQKQQTPAMVVGVL